MFGMQTNSVLTCGIHLMCECMNIIRTTETPFGATHERIAGPAALSTAAHTQPGDAEPSELLLSSEYLELLLLSESAGCIAGRASRKTATKTAPTTGTVIAFPHPRKICARVMPGGTSLGCMPCNKHASAGCSSRLTSGCFLPKETRKTLW